MTSISPLSVTITQAHGDVDVSQEQTVACFEVETALTIVVGTNAVQGPPGVGTQPVIHVQSVPTSIWTIAHNLGNLPDVTVFDNSGDVIVPAINHDGFNQVTLIFSEAVTGTARID